MDAIGRRAGVSIGAVYRFFENRDAPGLRPARRREAAHAYRTITTALMIGAADAGRHIAPLLNETRSVLLGDTNQLTAEAAE